MPNAASRSEEPDRLETLRLPCFATFNPHAAATKGAGGGDIDAVTAVTAGTDDIRKLIVRTRERGRHFPAGPWRHRRFPAGFRRALSCSPARLPAAQASAHREPRRRRAGGSPAGSGRLLEQNGRHGRSGSIPDGTASANAIRVVTYRHYHPFKRGVDRQPGGNVAADQRVIARDRGADSAARQTLPGRHVQCWTPNRGGFHLPGQRSRHRLQQSPDGRGRCRLSAACRAYGSAAPAYSPLRSVRLAPGESISTGFCMVGQAVNQGCR
ncbi:hypothetical protein L1887_42736 [Cichorium endivia]|nr:hypothetical protein L1887_42736 [Cichorium endivia]